MRDLIALLALSLPLLAQQEQTHASQVLGHSAAYRVFLPASYKTPAKRFPVIYWFHAYEAPDEQRDKTLADWVAAHEVILIDAGPADLTGAFPQYPPELIEHIDRTLRTIPDRAHRAITGFGAAGFLALWEAARSPDLFGSASSFLADRDAEAGPAAFPVMMSISDLATGLGTVKTWQSNADNPDIAATLDFHLKAFANPIPKPDVFAHADPYPNFGIWGWEVASTRRSPGFTVLDNVNRAGFHSAVREWLPTGPTVDGVKLSVTSPRLYTPGAAVPVTYVHVADSKVRHATQRADREGRLSFEVDGDEYEVGVGAGPILAIPGFRILDAAWATSGQPVKLQVAFLNKGAARSATETIRWESPTPGVKFETPTGRLFALGPGETGAAPVSFTLEGPARSSVRLVANTGTAQMTLDVRLFPQAAAAADFQIADGKTIEGYPHALGEGNRDGHASPDETFAILLPEGGELRAAEIFTNDPCIDNSIRVSESGRKYSLPKIRGNCQPGQKVRMLARSGLRYAAIEFPIWYRN